MSAVTVREFSYNPSAMFVRAEQGETIEVTRHGRVIAVVLPVARRPSRYDELIASGVLKPPPGGGLKGGDFDRFPRIEVPEGASNPLQLLLEEREEERAEEEAIIREIKEEPRPPAIGGDGDT